MHTTLCWLYGVWHLLWNKKLLEASRQKNDRIESHFQENTMATVLRTEFRGNIRKQWDKVGGKCSNLARRKQWRRCPGLHLVYSVTHPVYKYLLIIYYVTGISCSLYLVDNVLKTGPIEFPNESITKVSFIKTKYRTHKILEEEKNLQIWWSNKSSI